MRFFGMNFHRFMEQAGSEDQGGNGGTSGDNSGSGGTGSDGGSSGGNGEGSQGGQEGGQAPQKTDFKTLPQDVQEYISKLRGENADRRTENNNLKTQSESIKKGLAQIFGDEETDQVDPVQAFEAVSQDLQTATIDNEITALAYENGIPFSQLKYFKFRVQEELGNLGEGEEFGEEQLSSVLTEVKAMGGGKGMAQSSFQEPQGKNPNPSQEKTMTQEEFNSMSILQKSKLFNDDPNLYDRLMKGFRL